MLEHIKPPGRAVAVEHIHVPEEQKVVHHRHDAREEQSWGEQGDEHMDEAAALAAAVQAAALLIFHRQGADGPGEDDAEAARVAQQVQKQGEGQGGGAAQRLPSPHALPRHGQAGGGQDKGQQQRPALPGKGALGQRHAEQQCAGQGQRHAQNQKQGGVSHRMAKDRAVQQVPEVGKAHKPGLRHPLGEGVVEAGQKGEHVKRAHTRQAGEEE